MKKINLKESLLNMDRDTDCQYDLTSLYEACALDDKKKSQLAKYIDAYDIEATNKFLTNEATSLGLMENVSDDLPDEEVELCEDSEEMDSKFVSLGMEIEDAANKYVFSKYGEDEASYVFVDVHPQDDRIKVEVRTELDFEETSELANVLNPIVADYDKNAYFDHETHNILTAFIRTDFSDDIVDHDIVTKWATKFENCSSMDEFYSTYDRFIVERGSITSATMDKIYEVVDKVYDSLSGSGDEPVDFDESLKEESANREESKRVYVVEDSKNEEVEHFDTAEEAIKYAKSNNLSRVSKYVGEPSDDGDTYWEFNNVIWTNTLLEEDMKIIEDKKILNESENDYQDRIDALAEYLEIDPSEIKEPTWNWKEFETPEGDFLVLTEEEAREEAEQSVRNFIDDCGITGFSESFQDWIFSNAIDLDWFEDALREMEEAYASDIESEDDDEFGNRLIQEMYENGVIDDSDFEEDEEGNVDHSQLKGDVSDYFDNFVDALVDNAGDPVEYFRDNFGDRDFNDTVIRNQLYDEDMIVDEVLEWDGIAHQLATYDGEEIELSNGYYAYRTN